MYNLLFRKTLTSTYVKSSCARLFRQSSLLNQERFISDRSDQTRRLWAEQYLLHQNVAAKQDFIKLVSSFSPEAPFFPKDPSIFISYAWPVDQEEQTKIKATQLQPFLKQLALDLRLANFRTDMDLLNSRFGASPYRFMKNSKMNDFVLVMLTKDYKDKLGRVHMVEIEHNLIQSKRKQDMDKGLFRVAPIVLSDDLDSAVPDEYPRFTAIETVKDFSYCRFLQTLLNWWGFNRPEDTIMDSLWEQFYLKHPVFSKPLSYSQVLSVFQRVMVVAHQSEVNHQSDYADKLRNHHSEASQSHENIKVEYFYNQRNRNHQFTGRVEILNSLEEYWHNPSVEMTRQQPKKSIQVITGLGGVGKTELANQYLYQQHDHQRYKLIRWIAADDESIVSSIISFADNLGIKINEKIFNDIKEEMYFKLQEMSDWLLVFDNVESYEKLQPYLPKFSELHANQHILITTRNQVWPRQLVQLHELKVFTENESIEYTTQQLKEIDDAESILMLARLLGYLPLALTHATAYIHENDLTILDYIKRFNDYTLRVLNYLPQNLDDKLRYDKTVSVTFKLSLDKLTEDQPLAKQILEYSAYLNPNGIPVDWFEKMLDFQNIDTLLIDEAIKILRRYSLVSIDHLVSGRHVCTHPLVQLLTIESNIRPSTQDEITLIDFANPAKGELNILNNLSFNLMILEKTMSTQQAIRQLEYLLHHLSNCCKLYKKELLAVSQKGADSNTSNEALKRNLVISVLLNRYNLTNCLIRKYIELGLSNKVKSFVEESLEYYRMIWNGMEKHLLPLLSLSANMYLQVGELKKAKTNFLEMLFIINKKKDSHSTVSPESSIVKNYYTDVLNGLGNICHYLGETKDALLYFQKALTVVEQSSDKNSLLVGNMLTNIGACYTKIGEYENAKSALIRALKILERHYGVDYYQLGIVLNNLGCACDALGDSEQALAYLNRALSINKNHYGEDHYKVAIILTDISCVYSTMKNHENSLVLLQRALPMFIDYFGEKHYEVGQTLYRIAYQHTQLGDYHKALEKCSSAFEILKVHFGTQHQYTQTAFQLYQTLLQEVGKNNFTFKR